MVDMRAGSAVAQTIPSHTYSAICVAERMVIGHGLDK